ncbi:DUF6779 domain-containing protein, partial [Actinophytocola xanthii]
MNARRTSPGEPARGSFGGTALLIAAVVFALAATAVLVLSDDLRFMRLGILAALWAALVGAFVAARYRRQVADQEEDAAERQERYELELEREIAARREYELEVRAEARRQADEDAREDLAALRQELHGLRETLEGLLGGEFLVERYALRAESTRMRSLSDDRQLKRLTPAFDQGKVIPSVVEEAPTDLIERVEEVRQPAKRTADPSPRRPEPARAEHAPHPAEVSDRWFVPDGLGTNPEPAPAQPYAARQYAQRTQYVAREDAPAQPPAAPPARTGRNRHATVASGYMEPIARAAAAASGPKAGAAPPPARTAA